ncbi:hypothetical protein ANN_00576 [Periplaneta americana]|uniref:Uncharacterized protein n=1 Tax=Periplaneta americana TaxID=6978 RepID=A0ABQ8TU32_PERAM|nr:hypothetical protein ANN_00576 [Periplaneta americana]
MGREQMGSKENKKITRRIRGIEGELAEDKENKVREKRSSMSIRKEEERDQDEVDWVAVPVLPPTATAINQEIGVLADAVPPRCTTEIDDDDDDDDDDDGEEEEEEEEELGRKFSYYEKIETLSPNKRRLLIYTQSVPFNFAPIIIFVWIAKYQLEDIEVIGLLIGARGVIPKLFESFRKTFELPQTLTPDFITSVLKRSCQILSHHIHSV